MNDLNYRKAIFAYWSAIYFATAAGALIAISGLYATLIPGRMDLYVAFGVGVAVFVALLASYAYALRYFKKQLALAPIEEVLRRYGGVYKRIDENRELFEHIQQNAPALLRDAPWIEGWLDTQDRFLVEIANAAKPEDARLGESFPRPWPGGGVSEHSIQAQVVEVVAGR
jgi:hypothetical protein